jgi:23S rRNA-/tRNA-specific pseudouridylate synthase
VTETLPPLVLLYEDHDLVAVAKPSGEPVIPARAEPGSLCLQKRLERVLRRRLWVVHRIDRDASGVVVFALNADAHRALSLAFEHRQVTKTYAAFVAGSIDPPRGRIEVPLHAARKGKTRPARPGEPGGQPATTEYATRKRWALPSRVPTRAERGSIWADDLPFASGRVGCAVLESPGEGRSLAGAPIVSGWTLASSSRGAPIVSGDEGSAGPADPSGPGEPESLRMTVSLLDAHPVTGRHHQIRVHLRSAGTPILFDPLYGRGLMPHALAGAPCARLALHARRIDLPSPRGSGRVVVEAPLAPDLDALVAWLDAHGQGQTVGA